MKFEYKNWPFSNKIVPFPFSGFQSFSVYYGDTGKLNNAKTSVNGKYFTDGCGIFAE